MPAAHSILAAALALCAAAASGQTVYRCGSAYSQEPCPGGQAVDVTDKVAPADARNAGRVAAADRKQAEAMEKARLAQEKNAPKAIVIGPATPVAETKSAPKKEKTKSGGKPEQFTAKAPGKKEN